METEAVNAFGDSFAEQTAMEKGFLNMLTKIKFVFAVATIVVLGVSGAAFAKHQQSAAAKDAPKPGEREMARLKFYLGEWSYTESYGKTPFYPNGGQNTGVYTSKLGPGGNSLLNSFHSQGPVGDFEGLLIMTWDLKDNAYKAYIFGNDFPGCLVETGQFEGDTLVFRGVFTVGETKIALRNTTRLVAPGKISSSEYLATNGAPESLMVTVEATKK